MMGPTTNAMAALSIQKLQPAMAIILSLESKSMSRVMDKYDETAFWNVA